MSLQDSHSLAIVQASRKEKAKKNQATAKKSPETSNKDSPNRDNVIMFAVRARASKEASKSSPSNNRRINQMSAQAKKPEASTQQQGILMTPESLQLVIGSAVSQALQAAQVAQAASNGPQRAARRFPHSNRRPREVVMLSWQCDRETVEESDKLFIELAAEGKVRSKRETYELIMREGMKALKKR